MFRLATTIAIAALLATTAGAVETEQLDQEFRPYWRSAYFCPATREIGQIFTVGMDGYLSRIECGLAKGTSEDGLTLRIYDVENEEPNTLLFSQVIPANIIPVIKKSPDWFKGVGLTEWDVSEHALAVSRGDQLAITMQPLECNHFSWNTSSTYYDDETYEDGYGMHRGDFNEWQWSVMTSDLSFRTHVTVPEPSTIALLCMGVFGLLARGWRRRQ